MIVTTPQEVSIIDVRKEVTFCRRVGLPILGVVENMAGLSHPAAACRFVAAPPAGAPPGAAGADVTAAVLAALQAALPGGAAAGLRVELEVFHPSGGGAAAMCAKMGLPLLGRVPLDPGLGRAAEEGRSAFADGAAVASAPALQAVVDRILSAVGG